MFDLNMSGYPGGALTNKVGSTTIELKGNAQPAKKTILNADGEEVSFLNFAPDQTGGAWKYANGGLAIASVGTEVRGQNELTFACWVRSASTFTGRWDRLFNLGEEYEHRMDVETNDSGVTFRLGYGLTYQYTDTLWNNAWRYIVVSRKWVEDGTLTTYVYIDGELKDTQTKTGCESPSAKEGNWKLAIGGMNHDVPATFPGDIADFKVYQGVLSAETVEQNYNKGQSNFVEFSGGTLLTDGASIDIQEREVLVKLSTPMTLEEAKTAIVMTDAAGDAPEGGLDISLIGSQIARVRFGKLKPNMTYTLSDGTTSYSMTTGGEYLLNETFDDWALGEVTFTNPDAAHETVNGLPLGHQEQSLSTGSYVIEEKNGDKYLTISTKESNRNASASLVLPKVLTEGELVFDIKFKSANAGGSILPIAKLWGNSAGSGYLYNDGGVSMNYKRDSDFAAFKTDANGFYNVRGVLSVTPTATEVDGTVVNKVVTVTTFYDMNSSEVIVYTRNYDEGTYIGAVELVSVYSNGDYKTDSISLSEVVAYNVADIDVVTRLDGFNPANKTMELVFSEALTQESLESHPITISTGDKTISTTPVSTEGRRAVFALSEHLDYNTAYTLNLDGVEPVSGARVNTANPISFTTGAYDLSASVAVDGGVHTVTVENNTQASKSVLLLLAAYDAGGAIIELAPAELSLLAEGTAVGRVSVTSAAATTKLFVWDVTDGIMKTIPLSE